MEVAILLFQRAQLSVRIAADFAQVSPFAFRGELAKRHIPIHYSIAELHEDIKAMEDWNP